MSAEVAATLRRAKRVLIERGWTQGVYERSNGSEFGPCGVCSVGAMNVAVYDEADELVGPSPLATFARAIDRFDESIESDVDELVDVIAAWNDRKDRRASDVLAAFDRAIALAEADA